MDAIKLMQAPERLNEIWKSIRKTDLVTNGSPNLSIFQSIFDENKGIVLKYLIKYKKKNNFL